MNNGIRFWMVAMAMLLCIFSTGSVAQDDEPALEELKASIEELLNEYQMPAVSIAMLDEHGPVWIEALGKSNLEQNTDADANTLFRIGSISKMFVSLAVLKLVEQGALSLQDKLSDLAPEVQFSNQWEQSHPVRVVHLLEHTTGWDDIHLPEYSHNVPPPFSLKQGLDYHPHSRESRWIPGSRMSYSNSGPAVAARIIENITAMDFEDYVKAELFNPIGMMSTTYRKAVHPGANVAIEYNLEQEPQPYWHVIMRPMGSINASANDMTNLLSFFIQRGRANDQQLLSAESLQRMETATSTTAAQHGQTGGHGLGNDRSRYKQWTYRGHSGSTMYGLAELVYLPSEKIGHFIAANSPNREGFEAISKLIKKYETRHLPKIEPIIDVHTIDLQSQSIEGMYQPLNSRLQMNYFAHRIGNLTWVDFDEKYLVIEPVFGDYSDDYVPISDTQFVWPDTGEIRVSQVVDPLAGNVIHIGSTVFKKIPLTVFYSQLVILILWVLTMLGSILFLPIWLVRKIRGKLPRGPAVRVRIWPLLATFSVLSIIVANEMGSLGHAISNFGQPSVYSLTLMFGTYAFFAFSILGVFEIVRARKSGINLFAYWFSAISSTVHLLVALYLLWFGVIGIRIWSY